MAASMVLDGEGPCIAEARHHAAGFLTRAQADIGVVMSQRAVDLTALVVSELVTNAIKYAPGPIVMDLRIRGGSVEIGVWDSDPGRPVARAGDASRVGQHGLEIVMSVAQEFRVCEEPVGKRVIARIALNGASC
ncbi:ATP-binding protein [Streptomyces sp. NPDC048111]|uniref:ATP-binding protein n=1 Tax=Streptomyces sp. NPDC048111 TaxID=3365500 RepID=UPI003723096E